MGVDLLVRYRGKIIADIGRKHMYSFLGHVPQSYEEVEEELKSVREQVIADIMAFSGSMTSMDYDKEKHVELINEMVMEIKESLEWLEEESIRAGRVMTVLELGDEFNRGIEVIDDIALEIKETKETKEEEEYWKKMSKSIDEAEEADAYDSVEHQTSEVDLTWECDDAKDHKESIEEIGYCSECRKIEEENDEYLDRQNRQ